MLYKRGKNGIIYDCNKTEGKYINGLKQGYIKEYNYNEDLKYEGEFVNNEKKWLY